MTLAVEGEEGTFGLNSKRCIHQERRQEGTNST